MAFVGHALSGLRVAGVVVGIAVSAAVGAGYWFFVSQHRDYIVGRDFRILTNLARQVDSTARAEARVIANLRKSQATTTQRGIETPNDTWFTLRGEPYQPTDITFVERREKPDIRALPEYTFRADPELMLEVPVRDHLLTASLTLQRGLEPLFTSRVGPGAFEAIVLGTREGKVLISAGPGAQQLRSSGLDVLSSKATPGSKPVKFSELAEGITMADISLAGVDYTLFVAPCCRPAQPPLVLAGLVRSDTLRAASWAIPTAVVKLSVIVLLIALVAWPFLKLVLLGDRQKVRVSDFFQLGASSVTGLAILSVVLLDVAAYRRLNRDMDTQLRDLAHTLDSNATGEVGDAYAQLECIEQKVRDLDTTLVGDNRVASVLTKKHLACAPPVQVDANRSDVVVGEWRLEPGSPSVWGYPFFETVAFIDRSGQQYLKLETAAEASNRINVGEREYFKTIASGHGWRRDGFCKVSACALESVWSMTTGEPLAVLAKESSLVRKDGKGPNVAVAAISIPMRSLIGPVLPPGFAFAVIDRTGKVLFHSDRQRNGNEDFFVETDNNRRLRAQIAAHSADPLSINYWGAEHRAYVKPMELPDMYVVAMAPKERAWAINREWLVVTLLLLAAYLVLWLIVALATLARTASWVWPDPGRRDRYRAVSVVCVLLLVLAAGAARVGDPTPEMGFEQPVLGDATLLVIAGFVLPLVGWLAAATLLRSTRRPANGSRNTLREYSVAAVLLLFVSGVIPGALLFLASYRLHTWSYIKNSQLIVAKRLSDRYERVSEAYLRKRGDLPNPRSGAAFHVGVLSDRDIYVDFLYHMSVRQVSGEGTDLSTHSHATSDDRTPARHAAAHHKDGMLLSLLEDYLPYYSEASVEWRELLHNQSDDDTWESRRTGPDIREVEAAFTARTGRLPIQLTSWVPSITHVPPTLEDESRDSHVDDESVPAPVAEPGAVATAGPTDLRRMASGARDSGLLLLFSGAGLLALTCGVVQVFNRRVYLVGITQPLWACGSMARNVGENVLVLCDEESKAEQLDGMNPLDLGPIVRKPDFKSAWRDALFDLDAQSDDGSVLIADFDKQLNDACAMDRKLLLLDELVSDPSRRVVVLSQVSLRGLADGVRHAADVMALQGAAAAACQATLDRWKRVLKALIIVERRRKGKECGGAHQSRSPAVVFLLAERDSHRYVQRVCDDLLQSDAGEGGLLTRAQVFDELVERTAHFYRGLWESCSEDEKVVLGHVAQHGLANASVRRIVRQLLGRGLIKADPAFRPMNETFRHFILTRECSKQVEALEREDGPSAWDRLRAPLGVAALGVGIFLFATQKELYNAIFGIATAAAASVPALIQAVGKLVGRPVEGQASKA